MRLNAYSCYRTKDTNATWESFSARSLELLLSFSIPGASCSGSKSSLCPYPAKCDLLGSLASGSRHLVACGQCPFFLEEMQTLMVQAGLQHLALATLCIPNQICPSLSIMVVC